MVSIIIVNFNCDEFIDLAISSALKQRCSFAYDVVVVDNNSSDGSLERLASRKDIKLLSNKVNVGFGAAINVAARCVKSEYIAMLNPDAFASPLWLERIVAHMEMETLSACSSIVSSGSDIYFAGGWFSSITGMTGVNKTTRMQSNWLSGCALIVRRSDFLRIGGFDERLFLYYEDVDLSLRLRKAGFHIGLYGEALVDHPESGRSTRSLGARLSKIVLESRGRLIGKHVKRKWRGLALMIAIVSIAIRHRSLYPVFIANVCFKASDC